MKRLLIALGIAALALPACDDDHGPRRDLPPSPAPSESLSTTTSDTPSTASTTSSATDPGPSMEAFAGTWEGAYDAKKSRVAMPTGVRDEARAADDGKIVVGPGLVRITIAADGNVTGKSEGVLGIASIRGKIDGKMLRCSFVPNDLSAPHAMTGVLVGPVKDGVIQAELKVAGPDAILVRQANFDMKKKN